MHFLNFLHVCIKKKHSEQLFHIAANFVRTTQNYRKNREIVDEEQFDWVVVDKHYFPG